MIGLILTLAAVVAYSLYIERQIVGLRALQSDLVERNRKDSLQLLRIQNNLNQLGLAMRDMLDDDRAYPMVAWSKQFERIRGDLDDALARQAELATASRAPADRDRLSDSLAQFWGAVDRTFALAADGHEDAARAQASVSLQAWQTALSTSVARLLIENNEAEEQTAQRVEAIYDQVQRQVYWFLTATLVAIAATSLYVIRANRRLFAEMASLSDGRRELAQQLIATRESTLQHLSRELHDEVGEMAQGTLNSVRSLSQTLHPSILEELGLESTFDWYLGTVEKQLGIAVSYERTGAVVPVDTTIGIHVYRVLQEALSNVARHSGADRAWVRLRYLPGALELEVEDHGSGLGARTSRRGLGLIAMRERAELVGGTIEFARPNQGGTLVRLRVPLEEPEALDANPSLRMNDG